MLKAMFPLRHPTTSYFNACKFFLSLPGKILLMNKKNIAFLTGGYSSEAVISYKSAVTIENNLDTEKYNIYKIDIHPTGWWHEDENGNEITIDKNDFSITVNGQKVLFDAAFIGIHGTPGEDGKLQGYLDMLKIPYTSCDASTSALTFNKRYTVAVASFGGIKVAKSIHLFKYNSPKSHDILAKLQLPLFVKPNNGGSSIGMSKVVNGEDLHDALQKAFKEDEQVLVEEFISGREFTIGVFKSKGYITTLPITEVISKKDFFDYEAKYISGFSDEITPAIVDPAIATQIREAAKNVYEILNCRGILRIDFNYNAEK